MGIKEDMLEFIKHAFDDLKAEYDLADSPSKVVISREVRTLYDLLESGDMSELAAKQMTYDISKLMRVMRDDMRIDEEIREEYVEHLRIIG